MKLLLTSKQTQALKDYNEGYEHPCYDDRVIEALIRKGLVDENGITPKGRITLNVQCVIDQCEKF